MASILEFLSNKTENDLPKREVITVHKNQTADVVFKLLAENSLISAPIVNDEGTCMSIVDMTDLCLFFIKTLDSAPPTSLAHRRVSEEHVHHHASAVQHISKTPIESVANLSGKNPLRTVRPLTPLIDIIKILTEGVHRVVVVDAEGKVQGVAAQATIIKYLGMHLEALNCIPTSTLESIGLALKPVICARESDTAFDALKSLVDHGVSALAVVNEFGKLVGNLSVTDLKALGHGHSLSLLMQPVHNFILAVRQQDIDVKFPSIFCKPSTTLRMAVSQLYVTNIHRMYVVDHDTHPIGVVSLTDIMKALLRC